MKLPKYIYTIGKEKDSCLLVSTDPPYYVAQIYRFRNADEFAAFIVNCTKHHKVVEPYMFVLVLIGTMDDENGNVYADGYYLKIMTEWFLNNVLLENQSKYKRYKRREVQT